MIGEHHDEETDAGYAARHLPSQSNMKGVVNSWIFVTGDGDSSANLRGNGQLQINPAALYEVPVVLEMLSALNKLNFAVPNRAAATRPADDPGSSSPQCVASVRFIGVSYQRVA